MSARDDDAVRARAEARFKKAEARAAEGAEAKAEHDAGVAARDANTKRLKELRLERDRTGRDAEATSPAPEKSRSRKTADKGDDKLVRWSELNIALNALVRAGVILGYKARAEKNAPPVIEVAIAVGADQAEIVGRVRQALPAALSEATIRTRAG